MSDHICNEKCVCPKHKDLQLLYNKASNLHACQNIECVNAHGLELHTNEKLARVLEARNNPALKGMVKLARKGYFHDFESPLVMPDLKLREMLLKRGEVRLAERVVEGDFDATKEEADAWAQSPEGLETFSKMIKNSNLIMDNYDL